MKAKSITFIRGDTKDGIHHRHVLFMVTEDGRVFETTKSVYGTEWDKWLEIPMPQEESCK